MIKKKPNKQVLIKQFVDEVVGDATIDDLKCMVNAQDYFPDNRFNYGPIVSDNEALQIKPFLNRAAISRAILAQRGFRIWVESIANDLADGIVSVITDQIEQVEADLERKKQEEEKLALKTKLKKELSQEQLANVRRLGLVL